MSDRNAERGAGSSASASGAGTNLEMQLQKLKLQRPIQDPRWLENNTDFVGRVLASQYQFPTGVTGVQQPFPGSEVDAMSLAVIAQNRTVMTGHDGSPHFVYASSRSSSYSTRTPSLGSYPSAQNVPSIRTSNVSDFQPPPAHIQRAEIDSRPQPCALACSYSFLDCSFTSDDRDEWNTHCKAHFRGKLPRTVDCPFRCRWQYSTETGEEAWVEREKHICNDHSMYDIVETSRRPDNALLSHLWRSDIIDEAQLKALRMNGRSGDVVFLRSARSDRPSRRERR